MDKKRVWTLYRVSTKSQVNADEDIPMQRNACHNYASSMLNWEITNELYERGISGWKIKADDRDELQQIKEGAIRREFDILLIYFSDRLSRKKDEAPIIIEFLSENSVSVHSVNEGELRSVEHTDSLLNYIRYWQAEGESIKTSMRVKEQLKQMNEMGIWTGGTEPFGYELIETNNRHPKKDKCLKNIIINEEQANIVRIIFDLCANKGYGRHRIAAYLNERGYTNRLGKKFNDKFVYRLLNNPIYIGLKRYNTSGIDTLNIKYKTQPYNEDLRIIDDDIFYKAQELMRKRKMYLQDENKQYHNSKPNSSKVLLSGLLQCGYCKKFMKTDYTYKDYKRKSDNNITRMIVYRYRCVNGKNKIIDHPKMQVGAKHIDLQIENIIIDFIKRIDLTKIEKIINKLSDDKMVLKGKELSNLQSIVRQKQKNLHVLNEEIPKSLMGESSFAPDILNKSINQIEKDIEDIMLNIQNIKSEISNIEKDTKKIDNVKNILVGWEKKFRMANIDRKKMMLSEIIDSVVWKKENLEVNFKENLSMCL